MSDGKTILVDVSRCTGCRGCQVACKQWNQIPAGTVARRTVAEEWVGEFPDVNRVQDRPVPRRAA